MNQGTITKAARSEVLRAMQAEVMAFCHEKGWAGPVTFGDTMALLHSEVSQALEAYRDHGLADVTKVAVPGTGMPKPEGVGSEFADVLIRLLDDCDRWGVDLAAEFDRKMAYNRTRAYQHGGRAL